MKINFQALKTLVTSKVGLQVLAAKQNAPAVLFGAGVVGVVGTVVLASRATLKVSSVLDEFEDAQSVINKASDTVDAYTVKDAKNDNLLIRAQLVLKVGKLYAPAVVLGVASIAALSGSHVLLTRRNAGLAAALSATSKALSEYRSRVVDELGEDKDREFMFGKNSREVLVETKRGEPKVETVNTFGSGRSPYAAVFDADNYNFQGNLEADGWFLRLHQNQLNDKLRATGHIFLNDVRRELGLHDTEAGAVTGWVWGESGDDYIDFGCWEDNQRGGFDPFYVNADGSILLDFNVNGSIIKKLPKD